MISKFLYDVLLGVPLTLGKEIVKKIRDEIDKERLITEESIKERLQQLQLLLQDGELSEEEYEELEAKLIKRLRAVREYQKESR
ncbi:MAG: gas vesicle protein GvpG [Chloroflexi bacterium CG15_BIG_FIL_POST_REV_8_21_14_020_46_15]|nr:MAG: gas vesicle protein GvpG [Chloroflexi bacterium CG15_BIG_FIL_POST_REV_8_21_14_020_46_15]HUV46438.1 gas vesicle protein GvpG [Dehalococcoidia bacterium]